MGAGTFRLPVAGLAIWGYSDFLENDSLIRQEPLKKEKGGSNSSVGGEERYYLLAKLLAATSDF